MERVYSVADPYGEEIWNDMSKVHNPDKPLGDCECGSYDNAYLNVGRNHYGYCLNCVLTALCCAGMI